MRCVGSTRFSYCHSLTFQIELEHTRHKIGWAMANQFNTSLFRKSIPNEQTRNWILNWDCRKWKLNIVPNAEICKTDFPLHRYRTTHNIHIDEHGLFFLSLWGYGNNCTQVKKKYYSIVTRSPKQLPTLFVFNLKILKRRKLIYKANFDYFFHYSDHLKSGNCKNVYESYRVR